MKNIIKIIGLLILLLTVLSIPVYAEDDFVPVNPIEAFAEQFELASSELSYVPEYKPLLMGVETIGLSIMEELPVDYNLFGDFEFSAGLASRRISTFTNDKNLVGQGVEGMTIGLLVYTFDDEGEREVFDYKYKTLGASGLFSDVICFKAATRQYLVVAVKSYDGVQSRVYEVTTKEATTRSILENFELDFMPTESKPLVVEPLFDWVDIVELDF